QLKENLKQVLPYYMIPAYCIALYSIPHTPNRKVDQKALPEPEISKWTSQTGYRQPRNELEKKMAVLWENVLQKSPIGIDDNFFDLGGNSLKAVQLSMVMTKELGIDISVKLLFLHGTIAGVAEKWIMLYSS
ncbi:MAG: peptide synthase, partial [Desulfobacterales bacterium]|nr:peptide synthase [Desulfobacterales bacterium]